MLDTDKMSNSEIAANSAFVHFARLMLSGIMVEEGREVETCVKYDFDGDWHKFAKTAKNFVSGAYGVAG